MTSEEQGGEQVMWLLVCLKRPGAAQLGQSPPQWGLRSRAARTPEFSREAGNPDPYVKSHHFKMLATNLNSTKCCVGQIEHICQPDLSVGHWFATSGLRKEFSFLVKGDQNSFGSKDSCLE